MKNTIAILAVASAFLPNPGGLVADDNVRQAARPMMTLTGSDSHVQERGYHRITSEAEWIQIWQRHKGAKESENYDLFFNPLGLPDVDFERCMILAAFEGSDWNSAGLRAVAVLEDQDTVVLRFENKGYQTAGPGGGGKPTTVYGFFVLPRSDKAVVLEERLPSRDIRRPPVRKERAHFPKMPR